MLDLRRLHYFRAIAAHGSLSAAARVLNVAQPALTHHIAEMEQSFGVLLFQRSTRGVTLTAEGRRLLQHADAILDQVAFAEAEMRRAAAGRSPRTTAIAVTVFDFDSAGVDDAWRNASDRLSASPGDRPRRCEHARSRTDRRRVAVLRLVEAGTPLVGDSVVLVSPFAARAADTVRFRVSRTRPAASLH